MEAYARLQAQKQEELAEQTIESLHTIMTQMLKSTKKKKGSRHGKEKHTPTSFESLEEEDKGDTIHTELSSKHMKPSDSEEGGS